MLSLHIVLCTISRLGHFSLAIHVPSHADAVPWWHSVLLYLLKEGMVVKLSLGKQPEMDAQVPEWSLGWNQLPPAAIPKEMGVGLPALHL